MGAACCFMVESLCSIMASFSTDVLRAQCRHRLAEPWGRLALEHVATVLRHARDIALEASRCTELLTLANWLECPDSLCLTVSIAEVKSPGLKETTISRSHSTHAQPRAHCPLSPKLWWQNDALNLVMSMHIV
jgi:hypothetical protein